MLKHPPLTKTQLKAIADIKSAGGYAIRKSPIRWLTANGQAEIVDATVRKLVALRILSVCEVTGVKPHRAWSKVRAR